MNFPFYKQSDVMDCGPTCLQMICKYYGKDYSIATLRKYTDIHKQGTSLAGLVNAAETVGLNTLPAKIEFKDIMEKGVPLPCIVHWNQNHFVVLTQIKKGRKNKTKFYISDPATQGPITIDEQTFKKCWIDNAEKGVALLIEPSVNFQSRESEENEEGVVSWKMLWKHVVQHKKYFLRLTLSLLAASLFQLLLPFLTQGIVDKGVNTGDINFVYIVLSAQLMVLIARFIVDFSRQNLLLFISSNVNLSLLTDFWKKLMHLPLSYFDSKHTGDIMQRLNDQRKIESFLTGNSINIIFSAINLLIYSFVMLIYSIHVFFIFAIGSFCYILWVSVFLRQRRKLNYKQFDYAARENNATMQMIFGMQEIKLHNAETFYRHNWNHLQRGLFSISFKNLSLNQTQQAGAILINEGKNILVTGIVAGAVIKGELTLGSMLAIQYILGALNSPVQQFTSFVQDLQYPADAYTPSGKPSQIESFYNSNIVLNTELQFSPSNILYNETVKNNSQQISLDFRYQYDALNELLSTVESVHNRTQEFTYLHQRLTAAKVPEAQNPSANYQYSTAGNIVSKDGNTYTQYNAHFPKTIQLASGGIYNATQDACGRMKTRSINGATINFEYSDQGTLKTIKNGSRTLAEMLYDEQGNCIKEILENGTKIFHVSSCYKVIQSTATSTIIKYLSDKSGPLASVESGAAKTVSFFRRDHKGDITHVFDNTGIVQNTIVYDGFGWPKPDMPVLTPCVLYEGKSWNSDTGLYYFNARYYDPMTGTFITPDSQIGGHHPLSADVWNRFSFELNNPINHIDPSGHFSWKALGEGILASVASVLVTVLTVNPVLGAAAAAGIQTGFDHGNGKDFGLHLGADIATSAINDVISIPAIMLAPETGGASMIAYGVTAGALTGAASGFFDSFVNQKIMHSNQNINWDEVGYATAISAGIGAAVGALGAKTGVLEDMSKTGKGFWGSVGRDFESVKLNGFQNLGEATSNFIAHNDQALVKLIGFKFTFSQYVCPYNPD